MKPTGSDADILIFEPGTVGHRLTWLRYVTEDFLSLGYKVTWAVDGRPAAGALIEEQLSDVLPQVSVLSVFSEQGKWLEGGKLNALEACRRLCRAKHVFLCEFDEIASSLLRRAAIGLFPPPALRGRLSGVYFRPRFLAAPRRPVGNILKASGFRRLCGQGWFRHIYFVDEYLFSSMENGPGGVFHFLPDPWSGDYSCHPEEARRALAIPRERAVFLHYGMGDRRKGLHLAVEALEKSAPDSGMYLLCAGTISRDPALLEKLAALEGGGRAKIINRYVSVEEERLCFCAADAVLLPYIHHYGSSGVLSRAAAAGKPVIVSDDGLLAKRVHDHNLGFVFRMRAVEALQRCMGEVASMNPAQRHRFREAALKYAGRCTREAFRGALLMPFRASTGH